MSSLQVVVLPPRDDAAIDARRHRRLDASTTDDALDDAAANADDAETISTISYAAIEEFQVSEKRRVRSSA